MKLLKNIDDQFFDLGFVKNQEGPDFVGYTRIDPIFGDKQKISLLYDKLSKVSTVLSYDPESETEDKDGFKAVEMTAQEVTLCLKKMRSKKWKIN